MNGWDTVHVESFKRIVQPEMKLLWSCIHPHVISFFCGTQKESCSAMRWYFICQALQNHKSISSYDWCTRIKMLCMKNRPKCMCKSHYSLFALVWTDHWVSELSSVTESVTELFTQSTNWTEWFVRESESEQIQINLIKSLFTEICSEWIIESVIWTLNQ